MCSKCVLELGVDSTQQMELDIDREVSHDSISTSTTGGFSKLIGTHWNLPSAAACNNNCRSQVTVFVQNNCFVTVVLKANMNSCVCIARI